MKEKKKVLLGMSGGVDSSVSAILLQEQGYEVIGITMKLWEDDSDEMEGGCCNISATMDAKRVCDKLGIPHYSVNLKKEFKEYVMDPFVATYLEAKTPNPCIECNRYLKFGAMYQKAKELGIEYIATGHYAKTAFSETYGKWVLQKSASLKKDQSYVLYNMPKDMISHVIFPLEGYGNKEEIREIARQHGLTVANKPDSQEICFIPDNNYIRFLRDHMTLEQKQELLQEGKIVDQYGTVRGKHEGLIRYTIGQRKGLGIQNDKPLYVTKLSLANNQVMVGEKEDTYTKEAYIEDINLLLEDQVTEAIALKAKIRYSAKEANCTVFPTENADVLKIVFDEPQMAITPGQALVLYQDDIVFGGGKIRG